MNDLDLLADDLARAALHFLPADGLASIVGLELSPHPTVCLLADCDGAPRVVAREPVAVDHADLLSASGHLIPAWLSTLPVEMREAVATAISRGAWMRLYAHRDGTLALAVGDGRRTYELARRTSVAQAETVH